MEFWSVPQLIFIIFGCIFCFWSKIRKYKPAKTVIYLFSTSVDAW